MDLDIEGLTFYQAFNLKNLTLF